MNADTTSMEISALARPWLAFYGERPKDAIAGPQDMLSIFREAVGRSPQDDAIRYFDTALSYAWLDAQSDALAVWLAEEAQMGAGDRFAIALQNVPAFAVAVIAAWKIAAVPMPVNPAYKASELGKLFLDGRPGAVICHPASHDAVCAALSTAAMPATQVLIASAREHQHGNDDRVLPCENETTDSAISLAHVTAAMAGRRPLPLDLSGAATGLLLYTSGTTGQPKGAVLGHRALAYNACSAAPWFNLRERGRILGIAPLFHITGFQLQMCAAFRTGSAMLLSYRFEPQVVLDQLAEHRPTFMIAAVTAYIALMNLPQATPVHFASLQSLFSGGAPVPPAVVKGFAARFGRHIATAYGMTETSAQTHAAPYGAEIPVDTHSGALSIGIPISGVDALIVGADGEPAAVGESGEVLLRGPMLMDGYLHRPQETQEALAGGWLRTGDVGFMDAQGWFYLVDRKKDMIIASGFKVWPREVEDVLYQHPAVREAAVVGIPDSYRGETVKAYVSFGVGGVTTVQELTQHCRRLLTGYKVPTQIEFLPDLPKTASGKIMRSELRQLGRAVPAGPAA